MTKQISKLAAAHKALKLAHKELDKQWNKLDKQLTKEYDKEWDGTDNRKLIRKLENELQVIENALDKYSGLDY